MLFHEFGLGVDRFEKFAGDAGSVEQIHAGQAQQGDGQCQKVVGNDVKKIEIIELSGRESDLRWHDAADTLRPPKISSLIQPSLSASPIA